MILFKLIVDAVIRKWYADVMPDITWAESGLKGDTVGRFASLFYANKGTVGSQDPEWLQDANQHLCDLFRNCISLKPNTEKTEVMICHQGAIRGRLSNDDYKRQHEGTGDSYNKQRCTGVQCPVCQKDLKAGSL